MITRPSKTDGLLDIPNGRYSHESNPNKEKYGYFPFLYFVTYINVCVLFSCFHGLYMIYYCGISRSPLLIFWTEPYIIIIDLTRSLECSHFEIRNTRLRRIINGPRHDKTNKMSVRPAKTQISLGIRPVRPVFAVRMKKAGVLSYRWAHSEDSDQTGRMPRQDQDHDSSLVKRRNDSHSPGIWVFAGRTFTLLVLSCRGSNGALVLSYLIQLVVFFSTGWQCQDYSSLFHHSDSFDFCDFTVRHIFSIRAKLFIYFWMKKILQWRC